MTHVDECFLRVRQCNAGFEPQNPDDTSDFADEFDEFKGVARASSIPFLFSFDFQFLHKDVRGEKRCPNCNQLIKCQCTRRTLLSRIWLER